MGRYLTNTPNGTLDKAMTFDELEILLAAGLNVFPIFQTQGNKDLTLQQNKELKMH